MLDDMSLWRQIAGGVKVLWKRRDADHDFDEEAEHFIEERIAELVTKGIPQADAARQARVEFGGALSVREQVRDSGWENPLFNLFGDLRQALRRLRRTPVFTATIILTLALGVGATTAIFSLVETVLLRPLPFPDSNRLVALVHSAPGINVPDLRMSPSLYYTYRDENRVFSSLALWLGSRTTVTGLAEPEDVPSLQVTREFLGVLQTRPALGRDFLPEEDDPHGPRAVLLSNSYWQQRFGGSAAALGKSVQVNGVPHEIVGVLPATFDFQGEPVSLILPMRLARSEVRLIQFSEQGIARLKPGVSLEQANADIARCLPIAPRKFPLNRGFAANAFADARIGPNLCLFKDHLIGTAGETLWIVMGAVLILLGVACANVANLLLVRAAGRQHEFAVRVAMGAGWGRIARDLMIECLVLGVAGATIALLLSFSAMRLLQNSSGLLNLPRLAGLSITPVTVLFALSTSLVAAIIFGLIPVWKFVRPSIAESFRGSGGRFGTQDRERNRARSVLVGLQVALATVLLVGSGLMLRTFQALLAVDTGFEEPERVQLARVTVLNAHAATPENALEMLKLLVARFAAVNGVDAVAVTTSPPFEGIARDPVYAEGHDLADGKLPPVRGSRSISPGYVAALGTRLVAGREFTWDDVQRQAAVVMISENMARELWKDPRSALNRKIRRGTTDPWSEVIGVLADLRDDGLRNSAPSFVYWPIARRNADGTIGVSRRVDVMVRSHRAGSQALIQELRHALVSVHPELPLARLRTLDSVYRRSMSGVTLVLGLLSIAGGMALFLGVIGIYGVVSYSVAQRRRAIGIRIALGSTTRGVTRLFVREGLILAVSGAAGGLAISLGLTQLLRSLLFGVSPVDVPTFALASLALVSAALLATWIPATRAASVDPIEVLRME